MSDPYFLNVAETFYQSTGQTIDQTLDQVWQSTAFGSIDTAIGDNLYGINHRQTPGSIGINRDYFGLTFFTRPRLNLSDDNLRTIRRFGPLLTQQQNSLPRIIRCLLDPTLAAKQSITSQFVDPNQAFIPLLTNTLQSCTGWPDIEALTFAAHEGIYKESYSFVDSSIELYGTYDITANFRNIPGDPLMLLIMTWLFYAQHVYLGNMIPYPDALINNEIDYMTRIYRIVLDPSRRFVTKIAATGASFPVNVPYGAAINHDGDHPVNMNNQQISIQFKSNGIMYADDILIDEFNRTGALFNAVLAPANFTQAANGTETNPYLTQIPLPALDLFNNRGYPRINPNTYELEWWVDTTDYQLLLPLYQQMQANGTVITPVATTTTPVISS